MSSLSILGNLAGGYAKAAEQHRAEQVLQEEGQRRNLLGLTEMVMNNPNVPAEHKAAFMQYGMDVANTPVGKKLPDVHKLITSLPAPKGPQMQQVQTPPAPPLQLPGQPATGANVVPPGIGPETANGIQPPAPPPFATAGVTGVAPGAPATAGPSLQMPQVQPVPPPPQALGLAGQLHISSPEEQDRNAQLIMSNRIAMARQQFPNATPEQLSAIAAGRPMPKAEITKLTPGEQAFDESGKKVAENTEKKPLPAGKSAYEPKFGPGGELIGVEDNANGKLLTSPDEIGSNPEAKKVWDASQKALDAREEHEKVKDSRMLARELSVQTSAMRNAIQKGAVDDAKSAAAAARKAYLGVDSQVRLDDGRLAAMQKALDKSLKGDQQAMFALTANHIAMTVGQKGGGRPTQAMYNMAEQSAPLGSRIQARFGPDGYMSGVVLTPDQAKKMYDLAVDKAAIARQQAGDAKAAYDTAYGEYSNFVHQVGGPKVKTPEKPPSSGATSGKNATSKEADPLDLFTP